MKGDDSVSNSEAKKEDKLKKKQGKAKKLEAQKKLEQQLKQIDVHLATVSSKHLFLGGWEGKPPNRSPP